MCSIWNFLFVVKSKICLVHTPFHYAVLHYSLLINQSNRAHSKRVHSKYSTIGNWNVSFLECALFGICPFWIMLYLECALFGMCRICNVLFLECALFRMCPFLSKRNLGFTTKSKFRIEQI